MVLGCGGEGYTKLFWDKLNYIKIYAIIMGWEGAKRGYLRQERYKWRTFRDFIKCD
jgi:hypothetical protein